MANNGDLWLRGLGTRGLPAGQSASLRLGFRKFPSQVLSCATIPFGLVYVIQVGSREVSKQLQSEVQLRCGSGGKSDTMPAHMEVNRALINDRFDSWVSDNTLIERSERHDLPSDAIVGVCKDSLGEVRFKAQVQHNHLLLLSPNLVLYAGEDLCFYQITITPRGNIFQKQSIVTRFLDPPPHAIEGFADAFSPSIVLVSDASDSAGQRSSFLVSYGRGDLSYVEKDTQGADAWFAIDVSNWPNALRPLKVEAAVRTGAEVRCLVWATRFTQAESGDELESGVLLAVTVPNVPGPDDGTVEYHIRKPLQSNATTVMEGVEPPEVAMGAASTASLLFAAFTDGVNLSAPSTTQRAYDDAMPSFREKKLEVVCCEYSSDGGMQSTEAQSGAEVEPFSPRLHHWTLDLNEAHTFGVHSSDQHAPVMTIGVKHDVHACISDLKIDRQETQTDMNVTHVATIPAFAYVALGKPKRQFVQLNHTNRVAAVVEQERYAYVFESPCSSSVEEANHTVVDLDLGVETSEGGHRERARGARLRAQR